MAVVGDYAVQEYSEDSHPQINMELVDSPRAGLFAVSTGHVDAFVGEYASAAYYIEQEGISNIRVAGESGNRKQKRLVRGR